jgi:hypothetical protein
MATHPAHHNLHGHDASFTTPTALMLDTRLTPLERNGWQVLRMMRAPDSTSPLANLGQLRRYLASTPLGQRAGYETAWRVLVVLRLTGWISLVGQQSDPMTGHVLSELYQVHEQALSFPQACALDTSLPQLLRESLNYANNVVDRVAAHIQQTLEQTPVSVNSQEQPSDEDESPMPPNRTDSHPAPAPSSVGVARNTNGPQQTSHAYQATPASASTYTTYSYKKERTYRTHAREEPGAPPSVSLPPCLRNAKPDQQKDVLVALRRLSPQHRQEVLNELQARSQSGTVRNVVAYFFGLIKQVLAGEFRLWAGRKQTKPADHPQQATPSTMESVQSAQPRQALVSQPASRETALAYISLIRKKLNMPVNAGELAAQAMKTRGWQPGSA